MLSQLFLLVKKIVAEVVSLPLALVAYVRDWLHFRELANRFPGPPALPLVGNLFDCGLFPDTLTLLHWVFKDVMHRYPAAQIMLGPIRLFLLSDVHNIQSFLTNSKNQSKPNHMVNMTSCYIGNGLITVNGEEWNRRHKITQPSFRQNLLKTYVSIFDRKSNVFIQLLEEYANGYDFDVQIMLETLEIDIIFETLFGVPANQQTSPNGELRERILIIRKEVSHRLCRPWLYGNRIYNISPSGRRAKESLKWLLRFHKTKMEQRKELLRAKAESLSTKGNFKDENTLETSNVAPTTETDVNANRKQCNILIDALLMETGRSISLENVLSELQTFFMASFDTTTITMQFALYFLSKRPQIQEKAFRELQDIFDAAGSTEVTPDTLHRMQYLEMIVKETLRMHPPVFFYVKEAGVDTLLSGDLVVPAGATVIISPYAIHMDPKLYPDPHEFDPERFSPENCETRHPFAFIPFGAGMRICLGRKFAMMSVKTVISKVIWNYRILPDETYKPRLFWGLSTHISNGVRIKLLKR